LIFLTGCGDSRPRSTSIQTNYIPGTLNKVDWRQSKTINGPWGTIEIEPFSLRINRERIMTRYNLVMGNPVTEFPLT